MNKSTRMFIVGVAVGFGACYLYQNMTNPIVKTT